MHSVNTARCASLAKPCSKDSDTRHYPSQAIYSDFMEDVNVFEMVPFFSNKATLSLEVSDLKRERARLMNELGDQEERVIALQRKVREFREEVQSVKLEAAWSRSKQSQMEVLKRECVRDRKRERRGKRKQ